MAQKQSAVSYQALMDQAEFTLANPGDQNARITFESMLSRFQVDDSLTADQAVSVIMMSKRFEVDPQIENEFILMLPQTMTESEEFNQKLQTQVMLRPAFALDYSEGKDKESSLFGIARLRGKNRSKDFRIEFASRLWDILVTPEVVRPTPTEKQAALLFILTSQFCSPACAEYLLTKLNAADLLIDQSEFSELGQRINRDAPVTGKSVLETAIEDAIRGAIEHPPIDTKWVSRLIDLGAEPKNLKAPNNLVELLRAKKIRQDRRIDVDIQPLFDLLIDRGAVLEDDQSSALAMAFFLNDQTMINRLIAKGVNISHPKVQKVLAGAIQNRNEAKVRAMLNAGVKPDTSAGSKNTLAIALLTVPFNRPIVDALKEMGATLPSIGLRAPSGQSILHEICEQGLLEAYGELNPDLINMYKFTKNDDDQTALDLLLTNFDRNNEADVDSRVKLAERLVAAGAVVSQPQIDAALAQYSEARSHSNLKSQGQALRVILALQPKAEQNPQGNAVLRACIYAQTFASTDPQKFLDEMESYVRNKLGKGIMTEKKRDKQEVLLALIDQLRRQPGSVPELLLSPIQNIGKASALLPNGGLYNPVVGENNMLVEKRHPICLLDILDIHRNPITAKKSLTRYKETKSMAALRSLSPEQLRDDAILSLRGIIKRLHRQSDSADKIRQLNEILKKLTDREELPNNMHELCEMKGSGKMNLIQILDIHRDDKNTAKDAKSLKRFCKDMKVKDFITLDELETMRHSTGEEEIELARPAQ